MSDNKKHIKWFRDSSPYINAHRHKTFVLYLGGDALESANLPNIIADIALLNSLGVRLVLVHGAAQQIDQQLQNQSKSWEILDNKRVTPPELLREIVQIIGGIRANIEARLSMGLVNSPMHGSGITVVSGNFVKAKPVGIVDGIDFQNTGATRRIDADGICQQLDNGAIVLVSPLGYSPSGETFNLDSISLAADVAIALNAVKLIYFSSEPGIRDSDGKIRSELQADITSPISMSPAEDYLFYLTSQACRKGVDRCHIVSYVKDGALLEELFTRDGSGTQITRVSYEQIRKAVPEDVPGIIHLIEPLEQEGILVKRSRELIESEIEQFTIIERDGLIICCGALYPFAAKGELACLVTHPDYREGDRGESLLSSIEERAKLQGLTSLFVLTTQSAHWFVEHGFVEGNVSALPDGRKSFYNYQRNSKFFEKPL
ncbi:MAG: amino-acid N-acetyltransferase [Gammaproteobacteria bacterium]|jgi:amino-acid N-acetyltransferase|nr:amino-acid N-acetyltransferase [Gammaproteobacteria bacterium]|tara:strand:- start:1854 stop:3146 length:1293 start_codon:yes stop_codon:yes gene_type:complete